MDQAGADTICAGATSSTSRTSRASATWQGDEETLRGDLRQQEELLAAFASDMVRRADGALRRPGRSIATA